MFTRYAQLVIQDFSLEESTVSGVEAPFPAPDLMHGMLKSERVS